jgi:hypothetical protein
MKVTLHSTTKIVTFNGLPARIWEGHVVTDDGLPEIPIHAYITRVAVDKDEMQAIFERELQEHRAPSPEVAAIPLRMVL